MAQTILKKFLLPGKQLPFIGCGLTAAALSPQSEESCNINKVMDVASKEVESSNKEFPKKMRPSDLPIYSSYQPEIKKPAVHEPSSLEEAIGSIRKELWVIYDAYKIYEQRFKEIYETGKAHAAESLHFLQEEATDIHRAGAIGVGGLAGLVFGLRGGFFRKVFYTSVTVSGMTALCYPREAKEVTDISLSYAKYYITVGYNFIYGVKPEAFKFLPSPSAEGVVITSSGSVSSSEKTVPGRETSESTPKVYEEPSEEYVREPPDIQNPPTSPCSDETQDTTSPSPENSKLDEVGEMTSEASRDQSNPADKDMYSNRQ